ncbi:hypothetical protein INR49_004629 [Caranx melampygus]|nr:hypothetical protein INR49_004629 [Caranx melampygus]
MNSPRVMNLNCGWKDKAKRLRWKILVFIVAFPAMWYSVWKPKAFTPVPTPHRPLKNCPFRVSEETITPLNNTKHFQVSAYMDQRVNGFDIRIIGIFRRDSIQPLHCLFCCAGYASRTTTPATVSQHKDNFGFPFVTTDVMLLGVDRVVIYNTSCGSDLDRLLHSYSQEGFVEMVPWPIDKHMNPSSGWLFSEHGGDIHYFGQLTTLNECIYRSMDRSRYVLLNDIDEIIMPYQHNNLMSLMDVLQQQQPNAAVFLIENHIFPKKHFEPSGRFHLPQWNGVPGINILEHIYREEPNRNTYHPYKMIIQPRLVEQTSVHELLKNFGQRFKVPPGVCRIIHVRVPLQGGLTREQLNVDRRLWDFQDKLIPSVDRVLKRAGLLGTEVQS